MTRILQFACTGAILVVTVFPGQAADIYSEPPILPSTAVAERFWDGFYIGGFGGRLGNHATLPVDGSSVHPTFSGWIAGGQMGINTYLGDHVVAGIVGDLAWTDAGGYLVPRLQFRPKWQGSVRGKLGYDMGRVLPYVTGGVSFLTAELTQEQIGPPDWTESKTHTGWTIGGGLDVAVTQNVFLTGEYRYSSYGRIIYPNWQEPVSANTHQLTLGVNLKF